ncbi:MAG: type III-A CRISPR-associated RAMP protein Csm3 [Bacteroidetes bacterium]|nr:type III-A CRISPR-associated RAMP protein Csm3 [Bacteroidota bacterium]
MKLTNIYTLKYTITLRTGLHIGGNKNTLEIGGVDSPVIKDGKGQPFIPGSTIKGKSRSLIGKVTGKTDVGNDMQIVKDLFGDSGGRNKSVTRLHFDDAFLNTSHFKGTFTSENLDEEFSQIKFENTINRVTGKPNPRQIERIPEGAIFTSSIEYFHFEVGPSLPDVVKVLEICFDLLQRDYLGGSGSRGYGRVKISIDGINRKTFSVAEKPFSLNATDEEVDSTDPFHALLITSHA